MNQQSIDLFMAINANKFPEESQMAIREILVNADDTKASIIQATPYQDPTTLLIVSVAAGSLGIDRFMLGHVGLGIAKLITLGGCGIWHIVDIFLISRATKEVNYEKLRSITMY
jgi:TM2 domain-containing membrane protein YozV